MPTQQGQGLGNIGSVSKVTNHRQVISQSIGQAQDIANSLDQDQHGVIGDAPPAPDGLAQPSSTAHL